MAKNADKNAELTPEMEPSRYIEKVSLITGEVLDEPILPRQLLVSTTIATTTRPTSRPAAS